MIRDEIIAVGIPKSGNHALHKLTHLLGRRVRFGHLPYRPRGSYRAMIVTRDPRDIPISWLRFMGQPVTTASIVAQIAGRIGDMTLAQWHEAMVGWLQDHGVLRVRYESILDSVAQVAAFIERPIVDVRDSLPGGTASWMPEHTRWQRHWNDEIDAAWRAAGGERMQRSFGY